ncbi:MAG TPA: DUF4231 domain-containing protein [Candidatus Eisenbacteria bacterium]|nr:DUF4231 domain-containing protein [Candidatus Eisenbacteria bacterium]
MGAIVNSWDVKEDPNIARIEEQIDWYDSKSGTFQKKYKRIKLIEIVSAALIPFLSALHLSEKASYIPFTIGTVTALLGVLITILEGILQLQQYHQNWVAYRGTCEALRHEKFTYIAAAGVYATAPNPHALLVERCETIGSQENTKWSSLQQPQQIGTHGSGDGEPK